MNLRSRLIRTAQANPGPVREAILATLASDRQASQHPVVKAYFGVASDLAKIRSNMFDLSRGLSRSGNATLSDPALFNLLRSAIGDADKALEVIGEAIGKSGIAE